MNIKLLRFKWWIASYKNTTFFKIIVYIIYIRYLDNWSFYSSRDGAAATIKVALITLLILAFHRSLFFFDYSNETILLSFVKLNITIISSKSCGNIFSIFFSSYWIISFVPIFDQILLDIFFLGLWLWAFKLESFELRRHHIFLISTGHCHW